MRQVVDFDDVIMAKIGRNEIPRRRIKIQHFGDVVARNIQLQQIRHVGKGRQVGDVVVGQVEDLELVVLGEDGDVDETLVGQFAVDEARGAAVCGAAETLQTARHESRG